MLLWCSAYLYCAVLLNEFWTQVLFRLLQNETGEMFGMGRRKEKQTQIRWNDSLRSWQGKIIFYKYWSWKWSFRLVYKSSLYFRKISCFTSKNILSKVVLKYQVSMLTCPSLRPAYPKIRFRIMRTVNPLSQPYIIRKFQKYISISICHCHKASFIRSLFIAFKNNEWCRFVVRVGSPIESTKWSFKEWIASAFNN